MNPNRPGLGDFALFTDTPGAPTAPVAPQAPTPPPAGAKTIYQVIDKQQGGVPVSAFLHPAGWQADSGVYWDLQKHSMPLRAFARAFDPASGDWVEFFPVEAFYWIEPNMGFAREGQEDGGMFLMRPIAAADAMTRWILPRYRSQGVTGLKVVQVQPLDPQRLRLPGMKTAQGAVQEAVCVRIEFTANGRVMEEEFYGLKTLNQGIPSYGAAGMLMQYNWGFERLFSVGAVKGRLDLVRGTGLEVANSVRINPQWEQIYHQVIQQLAQQFNQHLQAGYENIAAATRLSHQISANNDAWLHNMQQQRDASYAADQRHRHEASAQQGAYTTSDAFGDMMMGRDTYDDPYYQNGSQHGYHDQVWTDGQGNYEYRDNGGADPNVGSDRSWTLLQKRQVGG